MKLRFLFVVSFSLILATTIACTRKSANENESVPEGVHDLDMSGDEDESTPGVTSTEGSSND